MPTFDPPENKALLMFPDRSKGNIEKNRVNNKLLMCNSTRFSLSDIVANTYGGVHF